MKYSSSSMELKKVLKYSGPCKSRVLPAIAGMFPRNSINGEVKPLYQLMYHTSFYCLYVVRPQVQCCFRIAYCIMIIFWKTERIRELAILMDKNKNCPVHEKKSNHTQ